MTTVSGLEMPLSIAAQRQFALGRLRQIAAEAGRRSAPEDGIKWVETVFPHLSLVPAAARHRELWDWTQSLRRGIRPHPFVAIWSRGSGKSTSAELAATYVGATGRRSYAWYVSGTQALADMHVDSIAALLESPTFEAHYPRMAERKVGKFGNSKGWRRNRLRCGNGVTFDALGLDVGARGTKVEEQRPDFIILDDIDELFTSHDVTEKRIRTITSSVLPAGSRDVAILCIQNLVAFNGFFGRMVNGTADYLLDRQMSGPHPAITDLVTEQRDGRHIIVGGMATWDGQDLDTCQQQMNDWGYTAFMREAQHDIRNDEGLFGAIEFQHISRDALPPMLRTVVVVDPAVTATDRSDSHGIAVASLGADDMIYHRWSFEEVATPHEALRTAIEAAVRFGSREVYVETNQGGELWRGLFDRIIAELKADNVVSAMTTLPQFHELRASASTGGKVERASTMLADYERGRIRHVLGTHTLLEAALVRFPVTKPFDLVDATVYAHRILADGFTRVFA